MRVATEKRTILIAGPTASGKSAAALALAEKTGGEIVNADALQVYCDLRVISSRPTPTDEAQAPHHLFGHVDGGVRYSAGEWSRDAARAIAGVHDRGKTAIVVGGTGLYFRALEHGLSAAPEIPASVRSEVEALYAQIGAEKFRERLIAVDPAMERLDPADRQRHLRAYEVFLASGRPLSEHQQRPGAPILARLDAKIAIEPPRASLYAAIDGRFDAMLAMGALEEARALAARRLDTALPVMKAVGAAELMAHLSGELTLDDAISLAKRNSRRLAKRQLTWLRNQSRDWPRAASPGEAADHCLAVASGGPHR